MHDPVPELDTVNALMESAGARGNGFRSIYERQEPTLPTGRRRRLTRRDREAVERLSGPERGSWRMFGADRMLGNGAGEGWL